ncbi:MAG: LPS export ABC transporter permease LptF [Gammaproteobacteria bacterium]|nr:LPS export ABC transporter permease LptF [Gammaproteobacteria bacterium]MCY4219728.1 LPS export ABC transporter permease LptF [Gammaproteobacteria bacterium]MCY4276190.1 LPS export ABC transporter permease LptF [Gammaproteobacteria bacterium]
MIIQQAFVRETTNTWVAVTIIIIAIFSVTRLVGFLDSATDGNIPIESVFVLLALKLVSYLDVVLVLSLYLSILLVLGRYISDREMTALYTLGLGLTSFLKPTIVLFMLSGAVVGFFSLYLGPLAGLIGDNIENDFRNRSDIVGISVGEFQQIRGGSWVYFIAEQDADTEIFSDIFLYSSDKRNDEIISARTAYVEIDQTTNDDLLVLKNGSQFRFDADDDSYAITHFETYSVRLRGPDTQSLYIPIKNRSTVSLLQDQKPQTQIELHWRLSKIVMLGILLLIALSFSSPSYRKGRFLSMLFAFLIYFFYSNMLGVATALDNKESFSPQAILWLTHFIFFVGGTFLLYIRHQNIRLMSLKAL